MNYTDMFTALREYIARLEDRISLLSERVTALERRTEQERPPAQARVVERAGSTQQDYRLDAFNEEVKLIRREMGKMQTQLSDHEHQLDGRLLRLHRGVPRPGLVAPDGTVYDPIVGVTAFCREHDLSSAAISQVLTGKRRSYKGWRRVGDDRPLRTRKRTSS